MNLLSSKPKHQTCELYAEQSVQMAEDALTRMNDASDRMAEAIGTTQDQIDVLLERVARLEQRKHHLDEKIAGIGQALFKEDVVEFPMGPISELEDLVVHADGSKGLTDGKSDDATS